MAEKNLVTREDLEKEVGDVKAVVEEGMKSWEELKKALDQELAEIKKNGVPDPTTTAKIEKLEKSLEGFDKLNDVVSKAQQAANDNAERMDQLETILRRSRRAESPEEEQELKHKYYNNWARGVLFAMTKGDANLPEEMKDAIVKAKEEYKALVVSNDATGGYLAPHEYVREIIKAVTEISPFRTLARIRNTMNRQLDIPKRTGQFAAQWTAESGTRSETTGLTFGMESIPTHEMYALVDVSEQNLEDSAFDLEAFIREEASEQFSLAEGTAFVTGNGISRPEGVLDNTAVASTDSGSAATIADTNGQANGIIDLYHAIKSMYARNGTWILNRTTLGAVRKLKDGNNNYIWVPGLATLRPNTILDAPYVEMPDMPNEGAGNFPIAFGDFRRAYVVVDRVMMSMLRDPYTQATSGNVRFLFRRRVGGQVVLAEAIRKLKCSA